MRGPVLLAAVWAALAGGLVASGLGGGPPALAHGGVPLPSDAGASLVDAWRAAWGLANASGDGWELRGLDGYENVRGFDADGLFSDVRQLEPGAEAIDGRVQRDGHWQFVFFDPGDRHVLRVLVGADGEARVAAQPTVPALQANPIVAPPRFDTPQAVLDCRRAGADAFMSEIDEPFVYYLARPLRGEADWMLFILVGTASFAPGEQESASCRLHQGTGDLQYIDPEVLERAKAALLNQTRP